MKRDNSIEVVLTEYEVKWLENVVAPLHKVVANGGRPVLTREESSQKAKAYVKEKLDRKRSL